MRPEMVKQILYLREKLNRNVLPTIHRVRKDLHDIRNETSNMILENDIDVSENIEISMILSELHELENYLL